MTLDASLLPFAPAPVRRSASEALASLARHGLVRRVQGVGSFVADAPVRHRVEPTAGDRAEALRQQALTVREEVLDVAAAALGTELSPAAPVAQRHGLRLRPAERGVTAAPAAPPDAEQLDIATGAPVIVLSGGDVDQHGRRIAQVAQRIRGDRAEYAVDVLGPAAG
jgi:DNA-binding GntR family transcriptional regulator